MKVAFCGRQWLTALQKESTPSPQQPKPNPKNISNEKRIQELEQELAKSVIYTCFQFELRVLTHLPLDSRPNDKPGKPFFALLHPVPSLSRLSHQCLIQIPYPRKCSTTKARFPLSPPFFDLIRNHRILLHRIHPIQTPTSNTQRLPACKTSQATTISNSPSTPSQATSIH